MLILDYSGACSEIGGETRKALHCDTLKILGSCENPAADYYYCYVKYL